jgi:uncharacterized repeat protein (TIGR01451 family)
VPLAASPGGATEAGNVATYTTTAAHGYVAGDVVTVAGVGVVGYNGTMTVTAVPAATRFTGELATAGLAPSGGGTVTEQCTTTSHTDGALFDADGQPAYCQMMSMHWGVNDADTPLGREVVREYRAFLRSPVHLYGECQAVNAIENNADVPFPLIAAPAGATQAGAVATFTTTTSHPFAAGDHVLAGGLAVAGWNRAWKVRAVTGPRTFTAESTAQPLIAGLAASGAGSVRRFNGLFLTNAGYIIGADPSPLTLLHSDEPFAQFDGPFTTVGGSERSYLLPPGERYKAQDVVMMTEAGVEDLWMTGYLDGECSTLNEFCDPQFAQGKVSYLGGHQYATATPISANGNAQGTRLFLNALLEAPCATDLGVASTAVFKSGPRTTNGDTARFSITAFNSGSSSARDVVITAPLPAGVAFVPPAAPLAITSITRTAGVVTVVTAAAHGLPQGPRVTVAGVPLAGFDGSFAISAVVDATSFRYRQAGANQASAGGAVRRATDGLCVGTAAQCGGAGGGVVTFDLGALGPGQTTAVDVSLRYLAVGTYVNTARVDYDAGTTPVQATSNATSTCYYAGNPAVCSGTADPSAPACANGDDDDGDGLIDFPDDPGCHAAVDTDELDRAPAGAKARVLIVFDTSGSMLWNTCADTFTGGDGSLACPGADVACASCGAGGCGNGVADDNRLFKVKRGIGNVVNGFGEVEWALMRFRQLPVAFACGTLNVNRGSGGWQARAARRAAASPPATCSRPSRARRPPASTSSCAAAATPRSPARWPRRARTSRRPATRIRRWSPAADRTG